MATGPTCSKIGMVGYMAFPNKRTIGPKNGQLRFGISEKHFEQNGIDITLLTRY